MKHLNYTLEYTDNLGTLDFSQQELNSIPNEIKHLSEEIDEKYSGKKKPLKEIILPGKDITELSREDFQNLNRFDVIHLIGLRMKRLSSDIRLLTHPIVVNFSWSDLVELPAEIYALEQLRSIRVNWTAIENFDQKIKNLKKLMDIEVSETPFLRTIYRIQDNDQLPGSDAEKAVWSIKLLLDEMGCELLE
ncbi:hypothetical protein AAG747_14230 [Rapidithrix thailandica]|uniref:Uncharacterized protein n=1 Tax=Rapidithrix thailandica TaxID=413964 RepID=A0AAW9S7U0_9BACT